MIQGNGALENGHQQNGSGIQVISRAANILRALHNERDGLSLGQIAERVGLPRSTVQRIVSALAAEHFLMAASPSGRVRLGPEILALAANSKIDLIEIAHPYLKDLSQETGETVDLAVLRQDHLVFVDQVVGSQQLRAVFGMGEICPLHCTANGKACLALMEDGEIRNLLAGTLGDVEMAKLLKELGGVRETMLAFDEEEHSPGISAVGTAFRDATGIIYAISLPAPSARFQENRERMSRLLLETRSRLCEVVGG